MASTPTEMPPPPNLMSRDQLLEAYYRDREEIAKLRGTLLSALAHLEGRSDMSTDGRWEPLMIDLIRKRVGWPPVSTPPRPRPRSPLDWFRII